MTLTAVHTTDDVTENEVLRLAGALEHASEHPIAEAIATAAAERTGQLPPVEGFENVPGKGVQGVVDGHAVIAGRDQLLTGWALTLPPKLTNAKEQAEAAGHTAIAVAWDGEVRAILEVSDAVSPPARRPSASCVRSG